MPKLSRPRRGCSQPVAPRTPLSERAATVKDAERVRRARDKIRGGSRWWLRGAHPFVSGDGGRGAAGRWGEA